MTTDIPDGTKEACESILSREIKRRTGGLFIPSRYPFTYAYDYVRAHADSIWPNHDGGLSRVEVAGKLHDETNVTSSETGPRRVAHDSMLCLLADRYLAENGIDADITARINRLREIGVYEDRDDGLIRPMPGCLWED